MVDGLRITDAKVRLPPRPDDKLKAFATIIFNDAFVVSDIKIIQGHQGLFVAMPSRRRKDGQFRDVAHPLNAEVREMTFNPSIWVRAQVISSVMPSQKNSWSCSALMSSNGRTTMVRGSSAALALTELDLELASGKGGEVNRKAGL